MDSFALFVNISWEPQVNILTQGCIFSTADPYILSCYFKVCGIFWNTDALLSMFCIGIISVYTPKRSEWIHFSKSSIEENSGLTYITVEKWHFISKLFYNFSLFRDWVKVAQLCLTVCDPMDYTVHGILQARIQEWVAFPFSRGSS